VFSSFDDAYSEDAAPGGGGGHRPLREVVEAYAPRFAEFAFEPGFLAAVDQHAAELRDRFPSIPAQATGPTTPAPHAVGAADALFDVGRPDREALSDYVLGFTDALAEIGWREPVGHDYAVTRLTALCLLVRSYGLLRPGG
jgi:hypothetical protein